MGISKEPSERAETTLHEDVNPRNVRPPQRFSRRTIATALGVAGLLLVPAVLVGGPAALLMMGRTLSPPPVPQGAALVLQAEAVVGTWQDDRGGQLLVRPDGSFTSVGACGDFVDEDLNSVFTPDSGSGTWSSSSSADGNDDPRVTAVHIAFAPSAVWTEYEARGTTRRPVLWTYIGDPDNGELCVLEKQP
ncbi:hypothetical protein [Streptomyces sp. H27-C3]|uniref:hypothetical protein n=1 Tax=Streptomyces sp. H27-C3 TaxID=3046305 RepID=UPI0024B8E4FE|nr:hypothetical protein [Streptomyces sp. H27-C3]MDJ0463805.1 hypothetical protein [Streptomyces sp. H27-C3]